MGRGSLLNLGVRLIACLVCTYLAAETNPHTLLEEEVFVSLSSKGSAEISWHRGDGTIWEDTVALTSNAIDDLDPTLCFDYNAGSTVTTFWRDKATPAVLLRWRTEFDDVWTTEKVLSGPYADARYPICAVYDGEAHVVFEERQSDNLRSIVFGRVRCPGPGCYFVDVSTIPTEQTSRTYGQLHVEAETMWGDWVHSDEEMAYVVFDATSGAWGSIQYATIQQGIEATREAIREAVLGD